MESADFMKDYILDYVAIKHESILSFTGSLFIRIFKY